MLSALRTADGVGRWRVFNDAISAGGPHTCQLFGDAGKTKGPEPR